MYRLKITALFLKKGLYGGLIAVEDRTKETLDEFVKIKRFKIIIVRSYWKNYLYQHDRSKIYMGK